MSRHPAASLHRALPDKGEGTRRAHAPQWIAAGLILLTAATVLEGYRWLNVIPSSRLHPSALIFGLLVVPTTLFLNRPPQRRASTRAQRVVWVAMTGLVAATVAEALFNRSWSARLLGAVDLLTAVALLVAVLSGADGTSP